MLTEEKYQKRRLRSSYVSAVVSITLVLFLVGIQGLIILHTQKLSRYVRENIGFTVILNDGTKEADIAKLQKTLDVSPFVKSTEYITKEQAAKELQADLGENFVDFLGYNPLLPSLEIRMHAEYANNDSLAKIEKLVTALPEVKEVYYQKDLVQKINDNVARISAGLITFGVLLLLIAVTLINSTIRLSVYAKRLTIKTMQLVGATPAFISRPFVLKGIIQGLTAAIIANVLLFFTITYLEAKIPELVSLQDFGIFMILFIFIFIIGGLFTWVSSYFAVRKFIKMSSDAIHY